MPIQSPVPPPGYAQRVNPPNRPWPADASIAQPKHIILGSKIVQRLRLAFPGANLRGALTTAAVRFMQESHWRQSMRRLAGCWEIRRCEFELPAQGVK